MNELLQNLIRLQSLEFVEIKEKNADAAIEELRGKIPPQIIAHYDRLLARGKKGVAAVRNQVCTGCHMRVPIAVVATLKHDTDIQICESCGRYLYLAEVVVQEMPAENPKPKPARKARASKKALPPAPPADPTMVLAMEKIGQDQMRPDIRTSPH